METVEAHVEKMEAELKEWGARLDKLTTEAHATRADVKADYRKRLDDLRQKYVAAENRFAELKAAGNGKWEIFQGGVEAAWYDLATAFTRLAN
jgi:chromosome segregation ATPase